MRILFVQCNLLYDLNNKYVYAPVYHANYGTNYYLLKVDGQYTYNSATTGNTVSGVSVTIARPNAVTYTTNNASYVDQNPSGYIGVFEITSFSVRSYSAGTGYSLRINYKVYFKELNGTTLGSYNGYVDVNDSSYES